MNPRKRMLIQKGRIGGDVEVFAKLPDEVLRSDAYKTLPHPARSVLTIIAAQYRGRNNGSLTLTRRTALEYGISNPFTLGESLREFEARGLVVQTRYGTKPVGTMRARSAMFAVTWCKIDPPKPSDPHDAISTVHAHDTWRSWRPEFPGMNWTVSRRERSKEKGRTSTRQFTKVGNGRFPMYPWDTSAGIPGIQIPPKTSIHGIPRKAIGPVSRGCLSEISGVGDQGRSEVLVEKAAGRSAAHVGARANADPVELPDSRAPASTEIQNAARTAPVAIAAVPTEPAVARFVGDLNGKGDELLRRAEALLIQHGNSAARAKGFLGQMKRPDRFGECFLRVAISGRVKKFS